MKRLLFLLTFLPSLAFGAVELDADGNGALDVSKGGVNTTDGSIPVDTLRLPSLQKLYFGADPGTSIDADNDGIVDAAFLPEGGGVGGYVSTPTYSDEACTVGQWSFDADYVYICEATDQWDRYAVTFDAWSNPTPGSWTLSGDDGAFGTIDVGSTSAQQTYTVTNTGPSSLGPITSVKAGTDAAQFDVVSDGCDGQTLAPDGTCSAVLTYSPDAAAAHSATFTFSAAGVSDQVVPCSGTGQVVCASGTVNQSEPTGTSNYALAGRVLGQSFTPDTNGSLYSVTFYLATATGGTMRCRWGNAVDLSTYYEEVTGIVPVEGTNEIVFPGHGAVTSGTKYYVACQEETTTGVAFFRNTASTYAGGDFMYNTSNGWALSAFATYDMRFEAKLCD